MFKKLKQKKKEFDDKVMMVVYCQQGTVSNLLQKIPYDLVFKTTHWCWNNCAHCCESSGTNMPKTFIPESVIKWYIDQAVKDKQFCRNIVFTGGEIMAAYKFAGRNYVLDIVRHALDSDCGVEIKTNAGWVNSPLAKIIYSDLETIVSEHMRPDDDTGIKNIASINVTLSLDSFHKDAMERDLKFIEHFANLNIKGAALPIRVSTIEQDKKMLLELMRKLADSGIEVIPLGVFSDGRKFPEQWFDLNKNTILRYSCGTLFNGGRAKDIESAYKTPFPQFVFMDDTRHVLMAFDSFGNVTLGENNGKKISVPWCDKETKQPLSLVTIRSNLVDATKVAEQEFLEQHKKMAAYYRNLINTMKKMRLIK